MFLASAGRIYSRKSKQEEFTRYMYDTGTIDVLKSALICLYEIPVKPTNIQEYLAEYLENGAVDIVEISKLRAELCFKKSEAQEMRQKHEMLDKKIFEMERRMQMNGTCTDTGAGPAVTSSSSRQLFNNGNACDGKQSEIMSRFLKDVHSFPEALSRPDSTVFKDADYQEGGENIERNTGEPQLSSHANIPHSSDSYNEFVQDMKRFDPSGLIFPDVKKQDTILSQMMQSNINVKDSPVCYNSENDGVVTTTCFDDHKSQAELVRQSRIDILRSEREFRLKKKVTLTDIPDEIDDDDDAKSLAELFCRQRLAANILDSKGKYEEEDDLGPIGDRGDPFNDPSIGTRPSRSASAPSYYDWDTEYWKKFFIEGDIFPKFGIRVAGSTKTSISGKQWDFDSKEVQLQYFNKYSFTSDQDDIDQWIDKIDNKTAKEIQSPEDLAAQAAQEVQRVEDNNNIQKPLEIKDEITARHVHLQDIWTVPKLTSAPIPLHLLDLSQRQGQDADCDKECVTVYPEPSTSTPSHVISTSTTHTPPTTAVAATPSATSPKSKKKSAASSQSNTSTKYSPGSSALKQVDDVIDTDVLFGDPPLLCAKKAKSPVSHKNLKYFSKKAAFAIKIASAISGKAGEKARLSGAAEEDGLVEQLLVPDSQERLPVTNNLVSQEPPGPSNLSCRDRHREPSGSSLVINTAKNKQRLFGKPKAKGSCTSRSRASSNASDRSECGEGDRNKKSKDSASSAKSHSNKKTKDSGDRSALTDKDKLSLLRDARDSKNEGERYSYNKGNGFNSRTEDEDIFDKQKQRASRGHSLVFEGVNKNNNARVSIFSKTAMAGSTSMRNFSLNSSTWGSSRQNSKMTKESQLPYVKPTYRHASEERNKRVPKMDAKTAALPASIDPCDLANIEQFHPYPELLYQRCKMEPESKDVPSRFAQFCQEHYDDQRIEQILQDYDVSIFDNM